MKRIPRRTRPGRGGYRGHRHRGDRRCGDRRWGGIWPKIVTAVGTGQSVEAIERGENARCKRLACRHSRINSQRGAPSSALPIVARPVPATRRPPRARRATAASCRRSAGRRRRGGARSGRRRLAFLRWRHGRRWLTAGGRRGRGARLGGLRLLQFPVAALMPLGHGCSPAGSMMSIASRFGRGSGCRANPAHHGRAGSDAERPPSGRLARSGEDLQPRAGSHQLITPEVRV